MLGYILIGVVSALIAYEIFEGADHAKDGDNRSGGRSDRVQRRTSQKPHWKRSLKEKKDVQQDKPDAVGSEPFDHHGGQLDSTEKPGQKQGLEEKDDVRNELETDLDPSRGDNRGDVRSEPSRSNEPGASENSEGEPLERGSGQATGQDNNSVTD